MRKFVFSLIAIGLAIVTHAQTLSLEDAILKRSLYPERLRVAQWIPNQDALSQCSANYQALLRTTYKGQTDTLVTLNTINSKLPEREQLRGLWGAQWVDGNTLYFETASKGYTYSLESGELKPLFSFPGNAANKDLDLKNGLAAFTNENNLYIVKGEEVTAVTSHENQNIIAGQSIARSEYGISKGTFWSPKGNILAFYEKDESLVADYPLLDITNTPGSLKSIK